MEIVLNQIYNNLIILINSSTLYGPILASFLIFIESILPILPLFVFIAILFLSYGYIVGYILSYFLTCLGCCFSFFLVRKFLKKYFDKKIRKQKVNNLMILIDKLDFSSLVLLIAIPFTPAFLINITAALSTISFKKFFIALIIGKFSLIMFWGFIGTGLIESLKNPKITFIIIIMLFISFLISKIVIKKLKFE